MKKIHWVCLLGLLTASQTFAFDELSKGAGLFSGKSGEFSLVKYAQDKSQKNQPLKLDAKDEFQLFKQWKQAKNENSANYQEFMLWLEYRELTKTE